jgi:hypothetical protein
MRLLLFAFSSVVVTTFRNGYDYTAIFQSRGKILETMDHSPINQNFELNKSRQKFHHSLKGHHKISNIPKFRCKML